MAKSLKYEWKTSLDRGSSLVSSMLFAPAAPCLSEHICIDAGPTFLQCLSSLRSVLCVALTLPLRIYEHYAAYGEAYQAELSCNPSHHSESKVWIVCLRCLHNCLISAEYNRVTKCLEWRFTTFIDLTSNLWCVFEGCINQRDWHQQAFHWVP